MATDDTDPKPEKRLGNRLRGWLSRLGLPLRIAIVLVPLLLIAGAAFGLRAAERNGTTDETCVACHAPSRTELGASVHAKLRCVECHVVGADQAMRLSLSTTFGVPAPPKGHAKQSRARCRACHFESPTERLIVTDTIGHKAHVLEGPKLECGSCHAAKKHSVAPRDATCDQCHDKVRVYEHGMKGVSCLNCHNFLASAERGTGAPSTDCQRCHGGAEQSGRSRRFVRTIAAKAIGAEQVHGALNACRLCHNPHEPSEKARAKGRDCAQCHKRVSEDAKSGAHKNCTGCHQVHGPRPDARTLCTACHQTVMPTGKALVRAGKSAAVGATALASRHERCTNCHRTHTFAPDRSACSECHKVQVAALGTWKSEKHAQCTNCHKSHQATLPSAQCNNCHAGHEGHRHPACTTCHDPHQSRVSTKKCATCHEPLVRVLAASPATGHRECGSCHQPHATNAALRTQCARCHGDKVKLASTAPPKHQLCKSCHTQHEFKKSVDVCRGCHAPTMLGQHDKNCQQCHQVHGPPLAKAQSCRTCHEKVAPPAGKHSECTSCHSPHQGPGKGPVCARCHQENGAGAQAWPVAKHQNCASCHAQHAPKTVKACGECHADKASAIDPAKHQCRGCHEPHRAPPGWWNACARCHKKEAASVSRAESTEHAGCRSCHKPHARGVPSCKTCHTRVAGLHTAKPHAKCGDCHKTHAISRPGRSECMTCHADRKDHFPNAQQCNGCHLFR
jgi:hypothetical protein